MSFHLRAGQNEDLTYLIPRSTLPLGKVVKCTGPVTQKSFKVTHPFHPLRGKEFVVVSCSKAWGEDRVYYINSSGQIDNVPSEWTDLNSLDPFVAISAGRSRLRVAELEVMIRLVEAITGQK